MFPAEEIAKSNKHQERLRKIVDAVKPREVWHGHYHRRYHSVVDFGYGDVDINGLDMDATELKWNVVVVDLELPGDRQALPAPTDVVLGTPGSD